MAAKTVLLVDSDARSLRVLEVSLRRAGFDVATAYDFEHAIDQALASPPEIVLTETVLPGGSGFDLCRRLREDDRTKSSAIVFLAQDGSPEAKIRGISAGADDYLSKPLLVKEILARLRALLERRQTDALSRRERPANFSGTLAGMGLVDLFQLLETGHKTCILHLVSDGQRSGGLAGDGEEKARIYFKDGNVIDAETSRLSGERAVYRLLLWEDGVFEIEFTNVTRDATIELPTQALLLEGMRRVDEWSRMATRLPVLSTKLEVDYRVLGERAADMPDEVEALVRLFDGKRTLLDVLDESSLDDLAALTIVARLIEDRVLYDRRVRASTRASLGAPALDVWLKSEHTKPVQQELPPLDEVLPDFPSVLGQVMIPSADTASQILAAVDPRPVMPPVSTALPEPIAEESAVLSRSTIPAASTQPVITRTVSMPAAPVVATPAPEGRLTVKRMSSTVSMPPISLAAATVSAPAPAPVPVAAAPIHVPQPPIHVPAFVPPPPPPAAPAPLPPATAAEVFDEENDDLAGSQRSRRGQRAPTYRTIRRPATAAKPGEASIPPAATTQRSAPPPAPPAEVSQPSRPASNVAASPPEERSVDEADIVGSVSASESQADLLPRIARPAAVSLAQTSAEIKNAVLGADTKIPLGNEVKTPLAAKSTTSSAEIRAAISGASNGSPFEAPRVAAPRGERVIGPPPASFPKKSELDAEFARLKGSSSTIEGTSDLEPGERSQQRMAVGLIVMMGLILGGFVYWFFADQDHGAPDQSTLAAAMPSTARPNPAWPSIPDDNVQGLGGGDPSKTTTKSASAAMAAAQTASAAAKPDHRELISKEMGAGLAALKIESYSKAKAAFQKVLEVDPENAAAHAGLANAFFGLGRDNEAIKEAKEALSRDENVAQAHLVLGLVASNQGRSKEAETAYRKYLQLDPNGPQAAEIRNFLKQPQ